MTIRMRIQVLLFACVLAVTTLLQESARAASSKSEFADAVRSQALRLERSAVGSFGGTGWQALLSDAAGAQFVMVGEQHGSASIVDLEIALHRQLAREGFTHSAMEIGPHSTRFAERLIRRGGGAIETFINSEGNGFSFPFLFFAEDLRLAEQIVALSPDRKEAMWGLDQEFVGSAPVHAALLSERAGSPRQRRAVEDFRRRGTENRFLVGMLSDADLAALESSFSNDRDALRQLRDLRESASIYEPFLKGRPVYDANLARETLMKENFQRSFQRTQRRNGTPPRVFLKFGGSHSMRGHSATDVPSLANFLMEWGRGRDFRLVNLMIDCDGGEVLDPQTLKTTPCQSYFGKDTGLADALASGPPIQMVDLRPLRSNLAGWKDLDAKTRQVVLAFDYYIILRGVRPATPTEKRRAN